MPQELQSDSIEMSSFVMPPPLNAYVYPLPMYIMKGKIDPPASYRALSLATEPNAVYTSLTIDEFHQIYTDLGARALKSNESDAVYDVPAHPLTAAMDDTIDDDPSDDDGHETSGEEDSELIDEDEDWEIDDDDVAAPG